MEEKPPATFRRVKSGDSPGFPRFKSKARFPGFSFKSHGDGWRFTPGNDWKNGSLRIGGAGHIKCRGKARQGGRICASDLLHRNGEWFLSLTVEVKNVPQKAGLNREILDTAPALLVQLTRYKVTETGGEFLDAPTRKLKPSQTCPACGARQKKSLAERWHSCPCGHTEPRDAASARVVLNWALHGSPSAPIRPGTGLDRGCLAL